MLPDNEHLTVGMIGDLYRVQARTVHKWRQRHPDFPQPVGRFGNMILFDRSQVQAWHERRGR